jgi:hypothetical protein
MIKSLLFLFRTKSSRDCFEADFAITHNEQEEEIPHDIPVITFFNNHLKSHYVPYSLKGEEMNREKERANLKRIRQGHMVADIVNHRFKYDGDFTTKYFVVCWGL